MFEKLTNQARFIKMIVDKELVISNRKRVDIIADLRKHKFRAFPKIKKAKEAGEEEDALEQEQEQDEGTSNGNDYDYLLGMAIASLTKEKVRVEIFSSSTLSDAGVVDRETVADRVREGGRAASAA
jgi:DNA topoisomerase-2